MVYNQIFTINSAKKTAQETKQKKKDESDFSVVIRHSFNLRAEQKDCYAISTLEHREKMKVLKLFAMT